MVDPKLPATLSKAQQQTLAMPNNFFVKDTNWQPENRKPIVPYTPATHH
jgi:hypothetical protein